MTEQRTIDITPHTSLMRKLSFVNFKFPDALAEFVDNSIDARVGNKPIVISLELSKDSIKIQDDGKGMNEEEAISSLRLADTTKEGTTNLGQFGLGLKTGALTLGKKFTVITTQEKLKNQFRIDFDEDKFEKEGDWRKHSFYRA